ncbi:hypothetical protein E3G52_000321 [Mycobacteroides abscessus]|uniref:hypothetical protein n=1 Tax=Mycobacteroides abscessus TaxID=36809 RepID=UPI001877C2AC|nr:hypothetical protein [Mycobacteroides abscessus]MBE5453457.1 hypothetical protein [Mycobacteroides abscessus]
MTERDPHRCAFGQRCINHDWSLVDEDNDEPAGALIPDGVICDPCMTRLEYAVTGLPRDWQRLHGAIGERVYVQGGGRVTLTPTPGINLNTQRDALQRDIVETADRAAEMVEEAMNITGKQRHGRQGFTVHQWSVVTHAVNLLRAHLPTLIAQPPQPMLVWGRIPDGDEDWHPVYGQPRTVVERDGIDIALRLIDLSRSVYRALGLPRLRHHSAMPCPAVKRNGQQCGAYTVGRWDGTTQYDCTTCGRTYGEREYPWLQRGVIELMREIEEREKNMQMLDQLKYLLSEAYSRLDDINDMVHRVSDEPLLDHPGAGRLIVEQVSSILTAGPVPHQTPEQRQTTPTTGDTN